MTGMDIEYKYIVNENLVLGGSFTQVKVSLTLVLLDTLMIQHIQDQLLHQWT